MKPELRHIAAAFKRRADKNLAAHAEFVSV
jgi:hypothetical protein